MRFSARWYIVLGLMALQQFGGGVGEDLDEDDVALQKKVENLIERILMVIKEYYNEIRTELKCIPGNVPDTIMDTLKKSIDCVAGNERSFENGEISSREHKKSFLKCFTTAKKEVKDAIAGINPTVDYCPENMTEKTYEINVTTTFTKTFHIDIKNGLDVVRKKVQLSNGEKSCVYNQGVLVRGKSGGEEEGRKGGGKEEGGEEGEDDYDYRGKGGYSKEEEGKSDDGDYGDYNDLRERDGENGSEGEEGGEGAEEKRKEEELFSGKASSDDDHGKGEKGKTGGGKGEKEKEEHKKEQEEEEEHGKGRKEKEVQGKVEETGEEEEGVKAEKGAKADVNEGGEEDEEDEQGGRPGMKPRGGHSRKGHPEVQLPGRGHRPIEPRQPVTGKDSHPGRNVEEQKDDDEESTIPGTTETTDTTETTEGNDRAPGKEDYFDENDEEQEEEKGEEEEMEEKEEEKEEKEEEEKEEEKEEEEEKQVEKEGDNSGENDGTEDGEEKDEEEVTTAVSVGNEVRIRPRNNQMGTPKRKHQNRSRNLIKLPRGSATPTKEPSIPRRETSEGLSQSFSRDDF